jgi:hypothetical protein
MFVLSTGEAWVDIMWNSFQNPENEQKFKFTGLLTILVLMFLNFFIIDLFTGMVVDILHNRKKMVTGLIHLSKLQTEWVYVQMLVLEYSPLDYVQHGKQWGRKILIRVNDSFWKEFGFFLGYFGFGLLWAFQRFPYEDGEGDEGDRSVGSVGSGYRAVVRKR